MQRELKIKVNDRSLILLYVEAIAGNGYHTFFVVKKFSICDTCEYQLKTLQIVYCDISLL